MRGSDHLQAVEEAAKRRDLVLFVGDEFLGDPAINHRTLARQLAEEFGVRGDSESLPHVAEMAEQAADRRSVVAFLDDAYRQFETRTLGQVARIVPTRLRAIVWLDYLGRSILDGPLRSARITYNSEHLPYSDFDNLVVPLLGHFDDPGSLVVTETDHHRLVQSRLASELLPTLATLSTLLIVGCDLHMRVIEDLLLSRSSRTGRHTPPAFVSARSMPSSHMRDVWRSRHVHYVGAEFDSVLAMLESWRSDPVPSSVAEIRGKARFNTAKRRANVFRFLDSYGPDDGEIFFGRERDLAVLEGRLRVNRSVLLYSASGVGKTSLLRAGLEAKLIADEWEVRYLRGWDGLTGFTSELGASVERSSSQRRLLVIDQLEELFTTDQLTPERREAELETLSKVVTTALKADRDHFIFSIREDFLGHLEMLIESLRLSYSNLVRLRRLSYEQARAAILGPFALVGTALTPELVDDLLSGLMAGDRVAGEQIFPPQLQILCSRLLDHAHRESRTLLDTEDLSELGGVTSVLSTYLDDVLSTLSDADRELARTILKQGVTSAMTRRPISVEELPAAAGGVLEYLVKNRLISAARDVSRRADARFELAHEYLIRRIQHWITADEVDARRTNEAIERERTAWVNDGDIDIAAERFTALSREALALSELPADHIEYMTLASMMTSIDVVDWCRLAEARVGRRRIGRVLLAAELGSNAARSNAAAALAALANDDREVEFALAQLDDVGNPRAVDVVNALGASDSLIEATETAIRRRRKRMLVLVPGGSFSMGSTPDENDWVVSNFEIPRQWVEKEQPRHVVAIDGYWIDRCPVTVGLYSEYDPSYYDQSRMDHPVTQVGWHDADRFARWWGLTLPSEAQWEKAARGTDGRRFPWGDDFSEGLANCEVSNVGTTTPVGSYPLGASPYGCLDMAGNVFEWTRSAIRPYPYDADDGREDPGENEKVVLRGGAFSYNVSLLRCALRYDYYVRTHTSSSLGFRCSSMPGDDA